MFGRMVKKPLTEGNQAGEEEGRETERLKESSLRRSWRSKWELVVVPEAISSFYIFIVRAVGSWKGFKQGSDG